MCIERVARCTPFFALASLVVACNGSTSYLDATGTAGRAEARLGIWLLVTSCVVVALVCGAILVGVGRRRPAASDATRREIKSGLNWIYVGIGATLVVLLLTFADTMVTLDAASRPPRQPSLIMDVT